MLKAINTKEEKRVSEFRKQYADKWFHYVVTKPDDEDDLNPVVMVIHVADTRKEIYSASDDEYTKQGYTWFGTDWGEDVNPEPGLQIGGIEYEIIRAV